MIKQDYDEKYDIMDYWIKELENRDSFGVDEPENGLTKFLCCGGHLCGVKFYNFLGVIDKIMVNNFKDYKERLSKWADIYEELMKNDKEVNGK